MDFSITEEMLESVAPASLIFSAFWFISFIELFIEFVFSCKAMIWLMIAWLSSATFLDDWRACCELEFMSRKESVIFTEPDSCSSIESLILRTTLSVF